MVGRTRVGFALLFLLLAGLLPGCGSATVERADLILVGGSIFTADPGQQNVEAVAVRNGKFLRVGTRASVMESAGPETEVVELKGASVLPGLIDGHVHLESGLSLIRGVNLYGIADKKIWLERIREKAAALEPGTWILGGRWDHTLTEPVELPTRWELDAVAPEHPVALSDVDGHSLWVNSLAIRLAGVDGSTPDPEGGRVVKDPRTGEPTGVFFETASGLVTAQIPRMTDRERSEALGETVRFAHSLGLTGVHNMSSRPESFLPLVESQDLTLRIWFGLTGSGPEELSEVGERKTRIDQVVARAMPWAEFGPRFELGYVKYMIDGVLSTRTAAMLEPYSDAPGERGLPQHEQAELDAWVAAANAAGYPVAIHAIGDRGVRMCLEAFEKSEKRPLLPNRIEHIEVLDPADAGRFAAAGVLASMNPHHCITGIDVYNTLRVGAKRAAWSFPWGGLQRAGATLVFGSDWATAPLNPLLQFYAAVLREKPAGGPEGGWYPEHRLAFEDTLHAYTQAPADAAGWGDQLGSITEGKWADFVVLDRALPQPFDRTILETQVQSTWVSGRPVFVRGEVESN
ncbi:MAG: amidohydrolase [Acidobacteriota bacterium]|nr:MAG: amidohydrolase [Acidobacteriota bacterium]